MMVDTSVVVAIMRNEPEGREFVRLLVQAGRSVMVAPNYVELCMVLLGNKAPSALNKIKMSLDELGIKVISFTPEMADVSAKTFERFGKGQGHKAQLNFGDCMAYAASKVEGLPLLFKGEDFRLTDVECAA